MSPPLPFVCVSGWGWHPLRRWRPSLHCTLTQWWRDAGTGCCSGRWWTDAVSELHCSCLGCWMHNVCGSLIHILQGAARINRSEQSRRVEEMEHMVSVTIHFSETFTDHIIFSYFPHRHTWALVWPVRTASLHSDHRRPGHGTSARWVRGAESGNLQTWPPLKEITGVERGYSGCQDTIILWRGRIKNDLMDEMETGWKHRWVFFLMGALELMHRLGHCKISPVVK